MKRIDEDKIRKILGQYRVKGPGPELVAETKRLMREELLLMQAQHAPQTAAACSGQAGMVLVLSALALLICFNFFYMATVGTILTFTLPPSLAGFIKYSIVGASLAGAAMVSGMVILIFFRSLQQQKAMSQSV